MATAPVANDLDQALAHLAGEERYFQPSHWFVRDPASKEWLASDDRRNLGRAAVALGPRVHERRDPEGRLLERWELDIDGRRCVWNESDAGNILRESCSLCSKLVAESQKIWSGARIPSMVRTLLASVIYGVHSYIEGPSGTAKSDVTQWISKRTDIPFVRIDANSEKGVLDLLGGEVPTGSGFVYSLAGALTPGALVVHIDEFPRLLATAANALLQLLAEGEVALNLAASGLGNRSVEVLATVIGTGNPVVGYAGQGERNMATFDRLAVGECSALPTYEDSVVMLLRAQLRGKRRDDGVENLERLKFTFRQARAALSEIRIPGSRREGEYSLIDYLLLASYAISPEDYIARWGRPWAEWDIYLNTLDSKAKKQRVELRNKAKTTLLEGCNPRGTLAVAQLARIFAATDPLQANNPIPKVNAHHVGKAFRVGNFARLKPEPGCEDDVKQLLEEVVQMFFPNTPIDDVQVNRSPTAAIQMAGVT